MPIYMTARFRVRPEAVEKCRQAIGQFLKYIRDSEPKTRSYIAMQDSKDATSFLHFFIFEDEAARDVHRKSDAVKRFTDVLYPETVAGVEFTQHILLASNAE